VDDDPYGMGTQFDDTELPQHRVWMDAYEIDRDEISLGEYLSYLFAHKLHPSKDLQHLIWHVITVHSVTDETLAQWPALIRDLERSRQPLPLIGQTPADRSGMGESRARAGRKSLPLGAHPPRQYTGHVRATSRA
jgi:formylglycine-generating enzyme required for sulfatase activity